MRFAIAVQFLQQLRARQHGHRVSDEHFQHGEFARTQRDAFTVAAQFARRKIHFETAEPIWRALLRRARRNRAATAQHRANPRDQLARFEGLAEIIVGAEFEADHAIDRIGARGQQNHGNIVAGDAQRAQRADAVELRHHDVEHDQRGTFVLQAYAAAPCRVRAWRP